MSVLFVNISWVKKWGDFPFWPLGVPEDFQTARILPTFLRQMRD
jgi:hypothetical protein